MPSFRIAAVIMAVTTAGLAGVLVGAKLANTPRWLRPNKETEKEVIFVLPHGTDESKASWGGEATPRQLEPASESVDLPVATSSKALPDRAASPLANTPPPLRKAAAPAPASTEPVPPDAGAGDAGATPEPEPEPSEEVASAPPPEPPGVPCGPVTCQSGKQCCNPSCGICTDPGQVCDQRTCGMSYSSWNESCGQNTCPTGQICCNASCGTCVPPGKDCDHRECLSPVLTLPPSESCGMNTCNVGEVCCNPSCGICKKFGEPCSREPCD
jgi:hypothetical protein